MASVSDPGRLLAGILLGLAACGMLAAQQPASRPAAEVQASPAESKAGSEKEKDGSRSPITAYLVGRVITVSGVEIEDAVLLVQDGRIREVGTREDVVVPPFAKVIERPDQVVMPGFVHPASMAYTGKRAPSFTGRSLKGALNGVEHLDPGFKEGHALARAGFTTLAVLVSGGGVAGQGTLVRPTKHGKGMLGVKDVVLEEKALLCMGFKARTSTRKFFKETIEKAVKYLKDLEAWKKAGGEKASKPDPKKKEAAKEASGKKPEKGKQEKKDKDGKTPAKGKGGGPEASAKGKKPATEGKKPSKPKEDPNLMPLVDVLEGRQAAVLGIPTARDFLHFRKIFDVDERFRPALLMGLTRSRGFFFRGASSGLDAWRVVDDLKDLKVAVILPTKLTTEPHTYFIRVTQRILLDHGIPVALIPTGSSAAGYPGFRFQLTQLVRHGIPRDLVLRAVTLTPAEILGIQDRKGSIEEGKDADLVFYSGDPLAPTSRILTVLVAGQEVYDAAGENES